jgi:hypothetical protein
MKTLPLLLIAGAGYFVLNQNKKSNVPKTVSDKDIGFTIEDCKTFIVTDYNKAMKWAFNKGKSLDSFAKDSGDKLFKCSGKDLTQSKENLIFFYNLMIELSKGYLSKSGLKSADSLLIFSVMTLLYLSIFDQFTQLNIKFSEKELIKPIKLPEFSKVSSLAGFKFDENDICKAKITNESNLINYFTTLSKMLIKSNAKLDNDDDLENEFSFVLSIMLESLASDSLKKCKEFDLEERFEYLAFYYFMKAYDDAKLLGNKKEINNYLSTWFVDLQKANIDTKGLPTKL